MKRAIAMAMIASTLLAGLAAAQPSSHGKAAATKGGEASADASRSMDAPYLAVPVVRDGRLLNYLFVSIRIEIAPGVDVWRTREQAHFLRDALVRACPRESARRSERPESPERGPRHRSVPRRRRPDARRAGGGADFHHRHPFEPGFGELDPACGAATSSRSIAPESGFWQVPRRSAGGKRRPVEIGAAASP